MTRMAIGSMLAFAALCSGCDRAHSDTPKQAAASEKGEPVTSSEKNGDASQSVALPPSKLPPSDATIKPKVPDVAGTGGQQGVQSQSNPKDLQKSQEQSSLPMSGQVNNHSNPESTDSKSPGSKSN